ncbi:glyoxal oxidase-related protein [Striga hermonthica]|uniref:Glyoxal oxidase-related protein n=1 Tax=Striga hermonthica TaxID=68872 RepID=A0A9N7NIY4_STRHE|nr:glyoxal oxidase-related protein [Striga hermonthica]
MENHLTSSRYKLLAITLCLILLRAHVSTSSAVVDRGRGKWRLLLHNTGVVAMHMTLTHHNTVIILDHTGSGPSAYQLRGRSNGPLCQVTQTADPSCYAHSVEYNVAQNKIRPLDIRTDTWSSSGSMMSNGTLVQTGGFGSGSRKIRYFEPCGDGKCDWREPTRSFLADERWYSSSLRLPEKDDQVIVLGGRNAFSYEFVPKSTSREEKFFELPFLRKTWEKKEGGNNLYPFLHLSSDGHLFVFANRDSILFNYKRNTIVKHFPRIPGKGSRSHPSGGSSVILPLGHEDGFRKVEVMICGGAADRAFEAASRDRFLKGSSSCGRMVITGHHHNWKMENMPEPRLMNDMIILPTGHLLIINGAKNGSAGLNSASDPSTQPYLYKPKKSRGKRFSVLKGTKIARMYHSSAVLLPDGRVLVAGSNPNERYIYRNVPHPTELRLQAFTPTHMEKKFDNKRPHNVSVYYTNGTTNRSAAYGEEFEVEFGVRRSKEKMRVKDLVFTAYAPPFNTHSLSMNQRMLRLKCNSVERSSKNGGWRAVLEVPKSPNVAPAGYYMLSVVRNGIPSEAQWVRFMHA